MVDKIIRIKYIIPINGVFYNMSYIFFKCSLNKNLFIIKLELIIGWIFDPEFLIFGKNIIKYR